MFNLNFTKDNLIKFNYDFPIFNWFYPYNASEIKDKKLLNEISKDNFFIFTNLLKNSDETALYFHIPFCQDICSFCPFTREILKNEKKLEDYISSLITEIDLKKKFLTHTKINSIFFGGGTPSILTIEQIMKLGNKINESFNLSKLKEFSFEMNAKTITEEKAIALKKIGVTHVRVGVQTFNLKYREIFKLTATIKQITEGISILKKHFKNVSIDILYGFNGETIADFLFDLRQAILLDVPNISLYPLNNKSIQQRLINEYKDLHLEPCNGLDRIGFKIIAKEFMKENGYLPHNGHDFVKSTSIKNEFMTDSYSFEYHKTVYGTQSTQLIGFGLSAISFFNSFIIMNDSLIENYLKNMKNQKLNMIILSYDKQLDKDKPIALHLPYHGYILKDKFNKNDLSESILKKIEILLEKKLIAENEKEYFLTYSGWLSYVNLLYFLSSENDQKLLIEVIENSMKTRDIGNWNFNF